MQMMVNSGTTPESRGIMEKNSAYLSIGEFSKVTRASIDSLRYYERKGIFSPAYVDPETGYRYYTLNQIYEISIAKACAEAGISLNDFKTFFSKEDIPNLDELFSYCERVAEQAYRDAFGAALRMRENRKAYLDQLTANRLSPYIRITADLLLLLAPLHVSPDEVSYITCISTISQCIKFANEKDIIFLSDQGAIFLDGTWYGFVSVHSEPGIEQKVPPEGEYRLLRFRSRPMRVRSVIGADITACFAAALKLEPDNSPVVIQEAWAYSLTTGFYAFDSYYEITTL